MRGEQATRGRRSFKRAGPDSSSPTATAIPAPPAIETLDTLPEISEWLVRLRHQLHRARVGEEADLARLVVRLEGRYRDRRNELA